MWWADPEHKCGRGAGSTSSLPAYLGNPGPDKWYRTWLQSQNRKSPGQKSVRGRLGPGVRPLSLLECVLHSHLYPDDTSLTYTALSRVEGKCGKSCGTGSADCKGWEGNSVDWSLYYGRILWDPVSSKSLHPKGW